MREVLDVRGEGDKHLENNNEFNDVKINNTCTSPANHSSDLALRNE